MRALPAISLLLASPFSLAALPVWQVDPVHSKVLVAVDHAGFSRSLALLPVSSGQLHYDPADPASARIEVVLEPALLDFGNPRWNAAVHGSGLLAVQAHPQARFRSTRVSVLDDGQWLIEGTLELRGTTLPVQLLTRRNGQRRHPLPPFRQTAGFSASGELSRAAFGVSAWPGMVGDAVQLQIELEVTRRSQPGNNTDADADQPS